MEHGDDETGFSLSAMEYTELISRGRTVLRSRILKQEGTRARPGNYMTMDYEEENFPAKVVKVIEVAGRADILIETKPDNIFDV